MNPSGLSPGITVAAPPALPEDSSVLPPESDIPGNPPGGFQVGTYNIGGANEDAKTPENIGMTTRTLASQLVSGVDVVALQEVKVSSDDARKNLPVVNNPPPLFAEDFEGIPLKHLFFETFDDHNEYLLAQIAAEEQGLQGGIRYSREERIDDSGNSVVVITGIDEFGRESQVTITKEFYSADGARAFNLFNNDLSANSTITTVYNADVKTPDGLRDYTVVFGPSMSRDNGTYGNSVVLGPDAQLQRDANGNAKNIAVHDLGSNDHGDDNGENRTALEVGITVDGEPTTIFNTHFTPYEDESAAQVRESQREVLANLVDKTGGNTLLLGDFNTGDFEEVGTLTGESCDENPPVMTYDDEESFQKDAIDRLYISADIKADNRQQIEEGGSDHDMLTWEIDLDGVDLGPTFKPGP